MMECDKGNKDNDTIAIAISFGMVIFFRNKSPESDGWIFRLCQQWPASQAENSSVATSKKSGQIAIFPKPELSKAILG